MGGSHFWNGEQFKPMAFQLSWSYLLHDKKQTPPKQITCFKSYSGLTPHYFRLRGLLMCL